MKKIIFILTVVLVMCSQAGVPKECEELVSKYEYYLEKSKSDKIFSERWFLIAEEYKNQVNNCVKKPTVYQQTRKR